MTRGETRWIARLWRPYLWVLALIVGGTLVSTAVRVSLPLVLKRTFDGLETSLTGRALLGSAALYLALGTVDWLIATGLIFGRGTMNIVFEAAARKQVYARLVRQAPGFFRRYRTGDLVTRLTDDVSEKLSWFICSGIFRAIAAAALILFAVVMMIRLDPLLTLFTVGPLPVLIVLFVRTGTVLDRRFDTVQKRISDLNGALEACFSGIRVVKAYGREEAEERSFRGFAAACRRAEIDAARSQTLIDSMFGHVWQLGVVAVLLAGGIGVMRGRLTLGTFVAFDAYVLMLIFPMFDIGTFFVRGRQSSVSIGRLRELEEEPPEIEERADAMRLREPVRGVLCFESVAYMYAGAAADSLRTAEDAPRAVGDASRVAEGALRAAEDTLRVAEGAPRMVEDARWLAEDARRVPYGAPRTAEESPRAAAPSVVGRAQEADPGSAGKVFATAVSGDPGAQPSVRPPRAPVVSASRLALCGVSFDLRPGQIVAVVGTVGSGKSTLLRLVPRLTDPTSGRVLLDGADLRDLGLEQLRRAVGYVPQEALLFTGTIRQNIVFGRERIDEGDLLEAVEVARLGRDLAGFADGLETRVGARGLTLSGGQKQRVALARALAGRPRILVLDDVTAALDAQTETALWEELHRAAPELATLVVTHRTATLERADRVLVLKEGRLIEQGTHAELSRGGAVYRSIYQRHLLEERVGVAGSADPVPDAERDPAADVDA